MCTKKMMLIICVMISFLCSCSMSQERMKELSLGSGSSIEFNFREKDELLGGVYWTNWWVFSLKIDNFQYYYRKEIKSIDKLTVHVPKGKIKIQYQFFTKGWVQTEKKILINPSFPISIDYGSSRRGQGGDPDPYEVDVLEVEPNTKYIARMKNTGELYEAWVPSGYFMDKSPAQQVRFEFETIK